MTSDISWIDFLTQQGASFLSEHPQPWALFNSANTDAADLTLMALTQYDLIEIAGPDSQKFLQGQFTCDVNALSAGNWQPGAACTPQGRVYGNFELGLGRDEIPSYLLRLPTDNIDSFSQQLGKYIVFYKSKLQHNPASWAGFELAGDSAQEALAKALDITPDELSAIATMQRGFIRQLAENRFECWLPTAQAISVWSQLAPQAQLISSYHRALDRISQGQVDIQAATAQSETPETINLTHVGAVSFEKGCYTGQEIVARMHYRGTAKSGLVQLSFDDSFTPLLGDSLSCQESGQKLQIINWAPSDSGQIEMLAVAPVALFDQSTLTLSYQEQSLTAQLKAFVTAEA